MRPAPEPTDTRAAIGRAFGWAALRLCALFGGVFYGADAWAAQRPWRWHLYAEWELALPYWPALYPLYHSVFLLPFLLGWHARTVAQVRHWERRMALAIVVGGAGFVMLPGELGFAPVDPGAWLPLAQLTGWVAGRHNLLPSLHVALSLLTCRLLWPLAGPRLRSALALWWPLLVLSVLLTHQHHLADVLTGAALGAWLGGAPGPQRPQRPRGSAPA
ncbi:MAG: hypothetical protein Q7U26_00570 [Aquabacterium sp.]|nr:hypothetical protein [Aquabacterium sp.]